MEERTARGLGASSVVGAVLAILSSLPSEFYGAVDTDAHVFEPAPFSPLWIERTVVPAAVALAGLLLVVGVAGLVLRDRAVSGRLRRWSGYVAVAGLGLFEAGMVVGIASGPGIFGSGGTAGPFVVLGALLLVLAGMGLAAPGLVAMGVGYARTERPRLGYALAAGPVLSLLVMAVLWFGVEVLESAAWLAFVLPVAAAFVAVGTDLWHHPDPLGDPGSPPGEGATWGEPASAASGQDTTGSPAESRQGDDEDAGRADES